MPGVGHPAAVRVELVAPGELGAVEAAARGWGIAAAECRTENGKVIHDRTGRALDYGALVGRAAAVTPPTDPPLKDPGAFRLIGRSLKRLDTPDKVNGKAVFGLDVQLPGMLVALVARPPVFGGKVKSYSADKAKAVPGVKHVVQIPRGIAVVAEGFWPAKKGREALEVVWDDGPLPGSTAAPSSNSTPNSSRSPG